MWKLSIHHLRYSLIRKKVMKFIVSILLIYSFTRPTDTCPQAIFWTAFHQGSWTFNIVYIPLAFTVSLVYLFFFLACSINELMFTCCEEEQFGRESDHTWTNLFSKGFPRCSVGWVGWLKIPQVLIACDSAILSNGIPSGRNFQKSCF